MNLGKELIDMKKSLLCMLLAMLLLTQGCCSIFTGADQDISVNSTPPGAKVDVGPYTGTTPYVVSIPRGKSYVIEASYGGKRKTETLRKEIKSFKISLFLLFG